MLAHRPAHAAALRLRAEALDALGDRRAPAAYAAAADALDGPDAHDLRAMQALAEIKQGDPAIALHTLDGLRPASVAGRLAQALAYSGAGVERAPIEFDVTHGTGTVRVAVRFETEVEGHRTADGNPTRLVDAVLSPVLGTPGYPGKVNRFRLTASEHGYELPARSAMQTEFHYATA